MQPRSYARVWFFVFIFQACLYLLVLPSTWQCEGVDEIEYLALADSLQKGFGYSLYGEPYGYYPPLYPTVLGIAGMAFGTEPWRWMHALNAFLGLIGMHLGALLVRRHFKHVGTWASVAMLGSYFVWSFSSRYLMSEPLYLALSMGTLYGVQKWKNAEGSPGKAAALTLVGLFLAATTRSAAITLTAAVSTSLLLHGLSQPTRRKSIVLAVLCAIVGFGFFISWEIRGLRINPDSPESYLRWAAKFIGVEAEENSIVANNRGEGIAPGENTLFNRIQILSSKVGQHVLSMPRVPANFAPLGGLISGLLIWGLGHRLWRQRDDVFAWVTLAGLGIAAITSWVSSYPRYLYVISPLVFVFVFLGAEDLFMRARSSRTLRTALSGWGLAGILWTFLGEHQAVDAEGMMALYLKALETLLIGLYLLLLILPALPGLWIHRFPRKTRILGVVGLVLLVGHATVMMGMRVQQTRLNQTLNYRNLTGVLECARWSRDNLRPATRLWCTYPLLVRYLADQEVQAPAIPERGIIDPGDAALTLGILTAVPAMPWDAEKLFAQAISEQESRGEITCVYRAGDAAVWIKQHSPPLETSPQDPAP